MSIVLVFGLAGAFDVTIEGLKKAAEICAYHLGKASKRAEIKRRRARHGSRWN